MNCANCGHPMKVHEKNKCTGSPDCTCTDWQRVKFSVSAEELAELRAELVAYLRIEISVLKEENARLKDAARGRGMVSEMADMTETAVLVCGLHDQLAAYKAEAMAAREFVNQIDEYLGGMRIDIQTAIPDKCNAYIAAKVNE